MTIADSILSKTDAIETNESFHALIEGCIERQLLTSMAHTHTHNDEFPVDEQTFEHAQLFVFVDRSLLLLVQSIEGGRPTAHFLAGEIPEGDEEFAAFLADAFDELSTFDVVQEQLPLTPLH